MAKQQNMLEVRFGSTIKKLLVEEEPVPHVRVQSGKELHGWWPGKRECTAERMLINPYNGCTHSCAFCYAHALWGYFNLYHQRGVVTVFEDFDKVVARQLDGLKVASCGYLSPVTDPFQPLNHRYRLAEKLVRVFVERNLPIEFITKNIIPDEVLKLMEGQVHSFGQVSIITPDEALRRKLVPGGASTEKLLENLMRLRQAGKFAVCRIDPVIPGITDNIKTLEILVQMAVKAGAQHIITSCMDIPGKIRPGLISALSKINTKVPNLYRELYTERIDGQWHARLNYRHRLFENLADICARHGVGFALCMEYELEAGKAVGLNRHYMTTKNCEGLDVPIYLRKEKYFEPFDCNGACLHCLDPRCGIPDLAGGGDWKLKDYRRWSRDIKQPALF
ncbi:SPL family radical SAM protein [Desulfolucanica intricata]|uniref:SPL family radical SAM protein n=1 Tax=Desulfolucanica intricata TaxID=1285191 RepID=UPI000829E27F|nr:radical SAM protein [Desulfolucanica intricata]